MIPNIIYLIQARVVMLQVSQDLLCHVSRSQLTSQNANTSFKVHEGLDTSKLCSHRACDFTSFTMFNQHDDNKSNNVFHLREDIVPSLTLHANYRAQGVYRGRHTTIPSW